MGSIILCLHIYLLTQISTATFVNFGVPENDFFIPGDINIVFIETFHYGDRCQIGVDYLAQSAEAVQFRIREINDDETLLPNINLGVVLFDDCFDKGTILFRATKLIPLDSCMGDCCKNKVENATNPTVRGCYDVVAALMPYSSGLNLASSLLLSMYEIPHISSGATSDRLSDKSQFGYFARTVPPDRLQTQAIMDLIVAFNWTYISLIGTTSDYSRNGMTTLRVLAKEHGICIAYSVETRDDFEDKDFDEIVRRLRINHKAHVVIAFHGNFDDVAEAIQRQQAEGEFVFIGSDAVWLDDYGVEMINSFEIEFSAEESTSYDAFEKYYNSLSPWRYLEGPGFFEKPDETFQCDIKLPKGMNGSCFNYERMEELPTYELYENHVYAVDGVNILAQALDTLIRQNCPSAFNDKSLLKDCIKGPDLLKVIYNTSIIGYRGKIQFDNNGEGMVNYDIRQHQPDGKGGFKQVVIGKWLRNEERLILDVEKVNWFSLNKTLHPTTKQLPESVCAKPCQPGEFYIQGELKCCWECKLCRDNERVREDNEGCVICPYLTWPDQVNFTTCVSIPPTYMDWLDPIALGLLGLSAIGLLTSICITYIFMKYRKRKVIKGSSLEQMVTIIIALFTSYATAILLISKPNSIVCQVQYYSYHLSCTLTFVPLLLKTTRLYRIFAAAEKCQQDIKYVSSTALAVFSLVLISCVVALLIVSNLMFVMGDRLQMPVLTEKFVELVCHIPLEVLLIPLTYNLLLLLFCAVFGFLTRKLPDNFNESWYIFISVTTTLFVWIAFLPTYFMAFYAYHKSALLALAIILNAGVTAINLFAPKIYAIYYINDDQIKVTNFDDSSKTAGGAKPRNTN